MKIEFLNIGLSWNYLYFAVFSVGIGGRALFSICVKSSYVYVTFFWIDVLFVKRGEVK